MSDTILAGWLTGATSFRFGVLPPGPPRPPIRMPEPDGEEVLRWPVIEEAIADLSSRDIVTQERFDRLGYEARRQAFTISAIASEDAIEKVRDALVEDLEQGGTLRQFREKVEEALGKSALSPSQIENVYRTNVGSAYMKGKEAVMSHPLVENAFPFVMDVSIPDSRRTDLCAVMATSGIGGTNIYLWDDPEYQRMRPLRHHNCRCANIFMTIRDAARKGIVYAQEWLKLGVRPPNPPYVDPIPAELPKGWTR